VPPVFGQRSKAVSDVADTAHLLLRACSCATQTKKNRVQFPHHGANVGIQVTKPGPRLLDTRLRGYDVDGGGEIS